MAKKFSELEAKMSPASRARANAKFHALLEEMPLHELRRARGLSQKALAEVLHVEQPAIAKLERRADMYISRCALILKQWAANWKSSPGFLTAR